MIVNVRIDERLIHGQVATMWTNHLKADRIMVVDNEVINNEIEKDVLKMAKPNSVKLSILTTKGAAKRIKSGQYDHERVFLIVKKPATIQKLIEEEVELPEVNVGNMSTKKESKQVAKSIAVTQEDIDAFKFLNQKGVKLTAQMVPNDDQKMFMHLLKEEI